MKALVVGLGSMGKRRVRNLKSLGVDQIIGFDSREDRRAEAATRYGIHVFETLDAALADAPAVVIISVPPALHASIATVVAQTGKSFFVEASVLAEGLVELDRLASSRAVIAFPSCTMRYYPGPRRLRELVQANAIGKVYAWQYQCGQYLPDWHPWEPITDYYVSNKETGGCREIVPFELVWLTQVFGWVRTIQSNVAKVSELPADIDDIYMLQVVHEGGILGQLTVDVLSRTAVRSMRITGELGTIEWDGIAQTLRLYHVETGKWIEERFALGEVETGYINPEAPYIEEIKDFLSCVSSNSQPEYGLKDDLAVLDLLYRAELVASEMPAPL